MGAGLGAWLLSACPSSGFLCQSDDQCIDGDREGVCTSDGRCAFSDEDCASGLAYGELAGPDLAGSCVPVDDASSTATDDGPVPSSDGASADETSAPACSPGSTCQPDDPCATAGLCNDAGSCVVTETIACDDPPSPCHGPGQCEPGGEGGHPSLLAHQLTSVGAKYSASRGTPKKIRSKLIRAKLIRFDKQSGKQQEYGLRLTDLLKRGDSKANVMLTPGDVIIIPESMF